VSVVRASGYAPRPKGRRPQRGLHGLRMQDPTVMQGALPCKPLIFIVHPRTALIFDELDILEAPLGPAASLAAGRGVTHAPRSLLRLPRVHSNLVLRSLLTYP